MVTDAKLSDVLAFENLSVAVSNDNFLNFNSNIFIVKHSKVAEMDVADLISHDTSIFVKVGFEFQEFSSNRPISFIGVSL